VLSLNVAKKATCFRNVSLLGDEAAKADLICSAFRRMVFMSWFFVLQCAGKLTFDCFFAARTCGVEILSLDYQFSKFTLNVSLSDSLVKTLIVL
jgi:hypothetical protein